MITTPTEKLVIVGLNESGVIASKHLLDLFVVEGGVGGGEGGGWGVAVVGCVVTKLSPEVVTDSVELLFGIEEEGVDGGEGEGFPAVVIGEEVEEKEEGKKCDEGLCDCFMFHFFVFWFFFNLYFSLLFFF